MKLKYVFICIGLFLTVHGVGQESPGIISRQADSDGNYAKFGYTGRLDLTYLTLRKSSIQIQQEGLSVLGGRIRPLLLNPESGYVSIGPVLSDFSLHEAALTINTFDQNETDLRLLGNGRMSTEGSFIFSISDNNAGDHFFGVKDSDYNDLFWVGEGRNNRMNGNLQVYGKIKENITKYHVINFTDFEVIEDFGDELKVSFDAVASDGVDGTSGISTIGASIRIPDKSTITGLTIYYNDTDVDGYMVFWFRKNHTNQRIFDGSNTSAPGNGNAHFLSMNELIDYKDNYYYIFAQSDDWDGQGIKHILVHYVSN